jgi:endonuclease/exonuclease/phosphatase family metal-dependent hydrolase
MVRVLSYNILIGGVHRIDPLTKIIRACNPDIVGLIEAIDEHVIEELANNLGMEYRLSGRAQDEEGWQGAVLSRLPIIYARTHVSTIITKQPLLEVCVEERDGSPLIVFITHLTAAFSKLWLANHKRRLEVCEILSIMKQKRGTNHLLMGDFNSIAPGEQLKGSFFLRYTTDPSLYYQLKPDPSIQAPDLNFVLPPVLRSVKPLLELVPRSKILCAMLDGLSFLYAPRGGFDQLNKAGFVDCFRATNPGQKGFTWPVPLPAGRVDFIFASPELAPHLSSSTVVTGDDVDCVKEGSDHLPLVAQFGNGTSSF